jgi:hypothetical protein
MKALLILIAMLLAAPAAAVSRPDCLKRDGDWLQGVTAKECRSIGGVPKAGQAKRRKMKH